MISNGLRPAQLDTRDHSLHRTFPKFGAVVGELPLMEYSFDAGFGMPNQNMADGRFDPMLPSMPYGCTGYTSTDICSDEDKVLYDAYYTYKYSCLMENHPADQGCDIRTPMQSFTVYGLRKNGETEAQALQRKRGKYYFIDRVAGRDWFDSMRLGLRGNKRSFSVGVPWVEEWGSFNVPPSGVLTSKFVYDGKPEHYQWHNVKVCGEKTINGIPMLRVKPWQGEYFGSGGWVYWDRETFNKIFDNWGTAAITPGLPVKKEDIKYVQVELYQQVLKYLNYLLAIIGKKVTIYA